MNQNDGERKALWMLKEFGYEVQRLDWIGKKNNEYTIFEIKERELFRPPPFLGTGLDQRQVYLRTQILNDLGMRTRIVVYEKGTNNIYHQYLDVLEAGKHYDTKNKIRIYPIENYKKLNYPNK